MEKTGNLTPDGVLLKQRFGGLLDKCGGVKRAEMMTRVGRSNLYDYANPGRCDLFAPIDVVADLERASGFSPVTEALAFINDAYVVKPTPHEKMRIAFGSVMPSIGQDIGELLKNAYAAAEDGKFSAAERMQLIANINKAISDLMWARGALEEKAR
jgi:hypothetical protein